ncbi:MAG: TetR/AcrR family transcriptional regulator [Thermoleophilaceae bacterium]|nr:TetR/AcrR family transcriptional regulator [Thermoleophilaceae bacterium]
MSSEASNDDQFRSRRDEYAEVTRRAVVAAARELFGEKGYSSTTVQEISRRARVSPATVYAQCGGKQGLLESLMDAWTAGALVREIIDSCAMARTGAERLQVLADGYLKIFETSGDIIRIVTDAAATSPVAAEFLGTANTRHHQALLEIVAQIRESGDLIEGLSDEDAANIIFFHFRAEQFMLAAYGFGWGEARTRDWLRERIESAILKR